jgi:hypothetical protein
MTACFNDNDEPFKVVMGSNSHSIFTKVTPDSRSNQPLSSITLTMFQAQHEHCQNNVVASYFRGLPQLFLKHQRLTDTSLASDLC